MLLKIPLLSALDLSIPGWGWLLKEGEFAGGRRGGTGVNQCTHIKQILKAAEFESGVTQARHRRDHVFPSAGYLHDHLCWNCPFWC